MSGVWMTWLWPCPWAVCNLDNLTCSPEHAQAGKPLGRSEDWILFCSLDHQSPSPNLSQKSVSITPQEIQLFPSTDTFQNLKPQYDLNQIPYDSTVEVRNRFKGLDLIECLMNYGQRFMTLYRRQESRPSLRKNEKKQNACLRRPYN